MPDTSSEFARQGTDAHTLCEFKVKTALGQKLEDPTKSLTYFDEEMAECTDEYAQFVMECLATAKASCKDPLIMIEQRLDFSRWGIVYGLFKTSAGVLGKAVDPAGVLVCFLPCLWCIPCRKGFLRILETFF